MRTINPTRALRRRAIFGNVFAVVSLTVGAAGASYAQQSDSAKSSHSDRRIPIAKEREKPRAHRVAKVAVPPLREPLRANTKSTLDTLVYRPDTAQARRTIARVDAGSQMCCLWGALAFPLVLVHEWDRTGGGRAAGAPEAFRFIPASLPTPLPVSAGQPVIPGFPSIPVNPPSSAGGDPSNPSAPGDVGSPSDPADPNNPGNAGAPIQPGNPGSPSDSSSLDPSDPWQPSAPGGASDGSTSPGDPDAPWTPPDSPPDGQGSVTATPEPATLLMLASGLSAMGIGVRVRSRRRSAASRATEPND